MHLNNELQLERNKLSIPNPVIETENNNKFEVINKISVSDYSLFVQQTGMELPNKDKLFLGQGVTAKIKITKNLNTGEFAALKIVPESEYLMSKKLINCDHVVNALDFAKKDNNSYYAFLPIMGGGDLHKIACKLYKAYQTGIINSLELRKMKIYIAQCIINGLLGMHRRNIYHLDTHPKNIMFDKNGQINIIDFGFSMETDGSKKSKYYGPMIEENKILPRWTLPPEFVKTNNEKSPVIDFEKADAYRLGVTLCTLDNYDKLLGFWSKLGKHSGNENKKALYHSYNRHLRELSFEKVGTNEKILTQLGRRLIKLEPAERSSIKVAYEELSLQKPANLFQSEEEYLKIFNKIIACNAEIRDTDITYDVFTQIVDENTKKDQ